MGYQIKFSVFDYEPITSSNLVGSITCPITTFIQQKHENLELKLTLQVQVRFFFFLNLIFYFIHFSFFNFFFFFFFFFL